MRRAEAVPATGRVDWSGTASSEADDTRLAALYDLDVPEGDAAIDWFRGLARLCGGPVLELGVGTGRVAIPLAKDGHDVVGLDRSPGMLARAAASARRARVRLALVEGDMRTFSLERAFALVAIPFNTFLLLTPEERWACLARCREHLAPAGRLAIDVFQPDPERIAGMDGAVREEWRRRDPESGRDVSKFSSTRATVDEVGVRWWYDEEVAGVVHRLSREITLHYLYRREAELLFAAAGFDLETLHGDYDGSPATSTSPKLLLVARRRARGDGGDRRRR